MAVVNHIRELRAARGWSQAQLAHALGVRQPTVSDWEQQQYQPALENILSLLKALNCKFVDLFKEVP